MLPDGSGVLYNVSDQLRRTAVPEINPIPVVTRGFAQRAEFSPDYAYVLYSRKLVYEGGTKRDLLLTDTHGFNPAPRPIVIEASAAGTIVGDELSEWSAGDATAVEPPESLPVGEGGEGPADGHSHSHHDHHGRSRPRPDPKPDQGKRPLDREPLFRHAVLLGFQMCALSPGILLSSDLCWWHGSKFVLS